MRMDAKVDDFFNEINEIAPPPNPAKSENVWKRCLDELTGYTYYWNMKTDEVTWTTPTDCKEGNSEKSADVPSKKIPLYFPPKQAPLYSAATAKIAEESVKIYSIGELSKQKENRKNQKKPPKRPYRSNSDSEDEKIVLISSYGTDSESDEEPDKKRSKSVPSPSCANSYKSEEEEDDFDILSKIHKRAKELHDLGGELPPEVEKVVSKPITENVPPPKEKKNISGYSLVAGYSDSDEENEDTKSVFPPKVEPQVSHSTLFPITKPIDITDFIPERADETTKPIETSGDFNTKAFQRKKRIRVALVNTAKKKQSEESLETERKGFGFDESKNSSNTNNIYPGFKKGGVMFVKTDVLHPTLPKKDESSSSSVEKMKEKYITEDEPLIKKEEVQEMYSTLNEKLVFLNGGRPVISPVQMMVIQAETLYMAMTDGGLKLSYLQKWLIETCSELIKLEKEAAPEGWLLEWDRSHKRYYYQNQITGDSQWEYPQPDIDRCDEAMDISTTPPPTEPPIHMSPPLPPPLRSPSPPPPPIISMDEPIVKSVNEFPEVPLTSEPAPPKFVDTGEPLPPGVDLPEMASYNKSKESEVNSVDPLHSALDSFYSDIAGINGLNTSLTPNEEISVETSAENLIAEPIVESTKKKKKPKVKLAPGLSMKKKGVSQLVEKWKNVQQHFDD